MAMFHAKPSIFITAILWNHHNIVSFRTTGLNTVSWPTELHVTCVVKDIMAHTRIVYSALLPQVHGTSQTKPHVGRISTETTAIAFLIVFSVRLATLSDTLSQLAKASYRRVEYVINILVLSFCALFVTSSAKEQIVHRGREELAALNCCSLNTDNR